MELSRQSGEIVRWLIFSDFTFDGTEDFLGVEGHSSLKHPDNLPDILDMLRNITIDDHKIGSLTDFDGANLIFHPKRLRAIVGRYAYCLYWAEARLRQQFDRLL